MKTIIIGICVFGASILAMGFSFLHGVGEAMHSDNPTGKLDWILQFGVFGLFAGIIIIVIGMFLYSRNNK